MSVSRETEKDIREINKRLDRLEQLVEKTTKRAKERKKRKPSAYNLFIGDCVKEQPDDKPVKDRFSKCVVNWKELSEVKKEEYRERAERS